MSEKTTAGSRVAALPAIEILGEQWLLPDKGLAARWSRCLVPAGLDDVELREDGHQGSPYLWTSGATIASIEARAGELLMFHAAGLSDASGAAVAMIGPSGTGKSTVSRLLCKDQFSYVTDETVAVDPEIGRVLPFAKPIAVIPEGGGAKEEFGPDELGLLRPPQELTLRGLVLLERSAGVSAPEVEVLGILDGAAAIVPHTSALAHLPSPVALLAETIDRCGGVHLVRYAEATTLADSVRQALAAPPLGCSWTHHPSADRPDPASTAAPGSAEGDLLARAAYTDAIEIDGDVQLMIGSSYVALQGVGAAIWLVLDRPRLPEALVDEVVELLGAHPEADALVGAAVTELINLGAVRRFECDS